jgi:hypothetical protein
LTLSLLPESESLWNHHLLGAGEGEICGAADVWIERSVSIDERVDEECVGDVGPTTEPADDAGSASSIGEDMETTDVEGRVESRLLSRGGDRLSSRAGETHGGSCTGGGIIGRMVSLNASFNKVSPGDGGRDDEGKTSGVCAKWDSVLLPVVDDDNQRTRGAGCFLLADILETGC